MQFQALLEIIQALLEMIRREEALGVFYVTLFGFSFIVECYTIYLIKCLI